MFSTTDHKDLLDFLAFFDVPMFAAERSSPDQPFRLIGVNAAHTATTTLTTDAIAGRTPHEILPPDDADAVAGHYDACATRGETIIYNETLSIAGRTRHWRTTLQPVVTQSGCQRVIGVAMETHDAEQISALTDTSFYAAQAQIKVGQLEAFLDHLQQRDDLPLDARSQAMMVAGLTRSLDMVLADIQDLTARQLHRLPPDDLTDLKALTLELLPDRGKGQVPQAG